MTIYVTQSDQHFNAAFCRLLFSFRARSTIFGPFMDEGCPQRRVVKRQLRKLFFESAVLRFQQLQAIPELKGICDRLGSGQPYSPSRERSRRDAILAREIF